MSKKHSNKTSDWLLYREELRELQIELVKLQKTIIKTHAKILVLFEGRDASGKDGTIKRIVEHLSPRETRVVALGKPSDKDLSAWYFQRYTAQLPTAQEMVLFNRSWYNRANVERVMHFCSNEQYHEFIETVPATYAQHHYLIGLKKEPDTEVTVILAKPINLTRGGTLTVFRVMNSRRRHWRYGMENSPMKGKRWLLQAPHMSCVLKNGKGYTPAGEELPTRTTRSLKKGEKVILANGWTAHKADNMNRGIRTCLYVNGWFPETGDTWSHEVLAVIDSEHDE